MVHDKQHPERQEDHIIYIYPTFTYLVLLLCLALGATWSAVPNSTFLFTFSIFPIQRKREREKKCWSKKHSNKQTPSGKEGKWKKKATLREKKNNVHVRKDDPNHRVWSKKRIYQRKKALIRFSSSSSSMIMNGNLFFTKWPTRHLIPFNHYESWMVNPSRRAQGPGTWLMGKVKFLRQRHTPRKGRNRVSFRDIRTQKRKSGRKNKKFLSQRELYYTILYYTQKGWFRRYVYIILLLLFLLEESEVGLVWKERHFSFLSWCILCI